MRKINRSAAIKEISYQTCKSEWELLPQTMLHAHHRTRTRKIICQTVFKLIICFLLLPLLFVKIVHDVVTTTITRT